MKGIRRWICILIGITLLFSMSFSTVFAVTKPAKVTNLSVKTTTYNSITIRWKKVSKASGYEIYRATSKNGTYKLVKTITSGSTVSFKNTGLKSNKTYYYKVRAFKKSKNKKIKGSFSTKVSGKTKKCLSIDNIDKNITLTDFDQEWYAFIYFKRDKGNVYFSVEDSNIVSCEWHYYDSDQHEKTLDIKAKKPGTTYITITNSHNSEKLKIKVTFNNPVTINLPKLPDTHSQYDYNNNIDYTYTINNISYEVTKIYDGTYTCRLFFSGTKDYDKQGVNYSRSVAIPFKLYQDNVVVKSGTVYASSLCVGEGFKNAHSGYLSGFEAGTYELVLLDGAY